MSLFMPQVSRKESTDMIKNKSDQNLNRQRETHKIDPDIEGLISKNLKHSFKDIIGME